MIFLCRMSSNGNISHRGRIVEITPEVTTVEIISESACGSCHAKGLCGVSEGKFKFVQVPSRGWDNYSVGDEVNVVLKASMGFKAVWIAYVAPLCVLLAVILVLGGTGTDELYSGLCAIAAVAVYYFFVWLFRKRLKNEYIFNIVR